jgi:serine protease Do
MRALLTALMGALALASSVGAAEKPWNFPVPPPATVQPLSATATAKSISLVRVFVDMPEGREWASHKSFGMIGTEVLTWRGPRTDADTAEFAHQFAEVLSAAGLASASQRDLFGTANKSDLQVGAIITNMAARFCSGCGMTIPNDRFKGAATMSVEWQVYSPLDRKVLATIRTTGASETEESLPGVSHILNGAFRENAKQLLASPAFRVAADGVPGVSLAQHTTLAPLRISLAPPKSRPVAETLPAVTSIFSNTGMGSGFLISPDGYVLTNQHVVGDTKFVKLKWSDGAESLGEVVRADSRRDVALIKTQASGRAVLALRRGTAQTGEPVFAVGTPLEEKFQNTLTRGIVSASRTYDGLTFIQSDVVINSGNSGGPLIDEKGAVIGICVSGMDIGGAPVGINLFIPIDDALKALALTPAS